MWVRIVFEKTTQSTGEDCYGCLHRADDILEVWVREIPELGNWSGLWGQVKGEETARSVQMVGVTWVDLSSL